MDYILLEFLDNNSDSDSDEFNIPGNRNENYLEIIVPRYEEITFFQHFRVSRRIVINLAEKYKNSPYWKSHSGQFGNISPINQLLIFLWFAGHQTSSFRDVSDRFDITLSSLHRIIRRLVLFLSNLSPDVITWPSEEEKKESELHFQRNGFPGVIGAIDGCHIKVDKPEEDPDSYINRKGFYSVQMQAVCDHRRKFIDVFIGYPGSVHDSRVFRNSPLFLSLNQKCGEFLLLGDSGYPLTNKLMVPYKDRGQLTRAQSNFNYQLCKNRYLIEHSSGILKQKFRQLFHIKLRNMEYIVHLIRACCVLHNIAINDDFQLPEQPPITVLPNEQSGNIEDAEDYSEDSNAKRARDRIANFLNNA